MVVKTTPANVRDDGLTESMVLSMRPIQGARGRPRTKPNVLQGDAGYGSAASLICLKRIA